MRLLKLVQTVLSLEHSPIPKTQLFALLGFAAATVILAPLIPDPDPDYYHSEYVSPTAADADDDKIFDKIHNSRMRYLEMTANDSGTDEDIPDDSPDLIDSEFADDDIENIFQDAFSKGSGKEQQQETEAEEDQNELDWLDYTVKEDDNLSTIFNTLNLPQKTLFMLLKTDKTKTLTRLKIGQKLHFLIDRNGNLLSLAISMFSSENEVIYVYDSRNDRYISYTDPAGTYQQADLERLVKEPQTDPATYAQSDTDSSFTEEEIKEYEKDEEKAEAEEEAAKAKEEQERPKRKQRKRPRRRKLRRRRPRRRRLRRRRLRRRRLRRKRRKQPRRRLSARRPRRRRPRRKQRKKPPGRSPRRKRPRKSARSARMPRRSSARWRSSSGSRRRSAAQRS